MGKLKLYLIQILFTIIQIKIETHGYQCFYCSKSNISLHFNQRELYFLPFTIDSTTILISVNLISTVNTHTEPHKHHLLFPHSPSCSYSCDITRLLCFDWESPPCDAWGAAAADRLLHTNRPPLIRWFLSVATIPSFKGLAEGDWLVDTQRAKKNRN